MYLSGSLFLSFLMCFFLILSVSIFVSLRWYGEFGGDAGDVVRLPQNVSFFSPSVSRYLSVSHGRLVAVIVAGGIVIAVVKQDIITV